MNIVGSQPRNRASYYQGSYWWQARNTDTETLAGKEIPSCREGSRQLPVTYGNGPSRDPETGSQPKFHCASSRRTTYHSWRIVRGANAGVLVCIKVPANNYAISWKLSHLMRIRGINTLSSPVLLCLSHLQATPISVHIGRGKVNSQWSNQLLPLSCSMLSLPMRHVRSWMEVATSLKSVTTDLLVTMVSLTSSLWTIRTSTQRQISGHLFRTVILWRPAREDPPSWKTLSWEPRLHGLIMKGYQNAQVRSPTFCLGGKSAK